MFYVIEQKPTNGGGSLYRPQIFILKLRLKNAEQGWFFFHTSQSSHKYCILYIQRNTILKIFNYIYTFYIVF